MRSCNTIVSFFQIVCYKRDITETSISTISVKFPWFPQDHPRQEIRIDRDIECIKMLIHEVDSTPCWEETDYCKPPVRVVKEPEWDEGHNQAACRCVPAQKSRWSSRCLKSKSARESPRSEADWWQMPGCPSGSGRTCLAVIAGLKGLCLVSIARILSGGG